MIRSSLLILTFGLTAPLPAACADTPKVERFEMSTQERARFREVIRKMKEIVRQEEAIVASGRYCGSLEEIQRSRQILRQWEWAYENDLPPPVKLPPATKRP